MAQIKFRGMLLGSEEIKLRSGETMPVHKFIEMDTAAQFQVKFPGKIEAKKMLPYDWELSCLIETGAAFRIFITADAVSAIPVGKG